MGDRVPALFSRVLLMNTLSFRRIAGGTAWLFADRLFRMLLGFGVSIVLARHFGPVGFGQINFVVAMAALFYGVSSLGFDDLLPRDMADPGQALPLASVWKTALALRVLAGGLAYLLLLLLLVVEGSHAGDTAGRPLLFFLALIYGLHYPLQAADVCEQLLRVSRHYTEIVRIRSLAAFLSALLKLGVVAGNSSLPVLAVAMLLEHVLVALFYVWLSRRDAQFGGGHFEPAYARFLLQRSWKIIFAGLLAMLQVRMEYFLVEKFLGWNEVGQYSVALKIVELFDFATAIIASVLLPEVVRQQREANSQQQTMRRIYLAAIAFYFLLLPFMLLALILFPVAYGAAYAPAALILPFLMLRPLLVMLGATRTIALMAEQRFWLPPLASLLGLLTATLAGGVLIPEYGLMGAVGMALSGLLVSNVLVDMLFYRKNFFCLLTCPLEIPAVWQWCRNRLRTTG